MITKQKNSPTHSNRLLWIDLTRALLIITMIIFHSYWDLLYFNYIDYNKTTNFYFIVLARLTCAGFLTLAGFNLCIQWQRSDSRIFYKKFIRRFYKITIAALLISISTYLVMPEQFIYFGILHNMLITSLICLFLLNLSLAYNLMIATFLFTAKFWALTLMDKISSHTLLSLLSFLLFSPYTRNSVDFVPILPWSGFGVLGLIIAMIFYKKSYNFRSYDVAKHKILSFIASKSLYIYLIHQPLLFTIFWLKN